MRYLPHTAAERTAILAQLGVPNIDALYSAVPTAQRPPFDFTPYLQAPGLAPTALPQPEAEVTRLLQTLAARNRPAGAGPFFLGAGCYRHHIPATVDYIIQRSEFMTAYTPYQPELAQGTLTYLFEFQTYVARLFGQDIANASMYDGPTALAEAALMAQRLTQRAAIVVRGSLHPQAIEVLQTYVQSRGGTVLMRPPTDPATVAAVVVSYPQFAGSVPDLAAAKAEADALGAKLIVYVPTVVALGLLPPPTMADIVAGEGQALGVGLQFGGPHLGLFACRQEYVRQMPGRLCGQTVDADGRRSFTLTLNTREQHIRRDKATSNICTNQGLMALAFTVHLSLLGEHGLPHLAQLNHQAACHLADALAAVPGCTIKNTTFFNEFVVCFARPLGSLLNLCATRGIVPGYPLNDHDLLVCVTETATMADHAALVQAVQEAQA